MPREKLGIIAQREMMVSIFDDLYTNRRRIYKINFFRGMFFGLGSFLGGTIVVAFVVWILTWFIDFPLVGEWIRRFIDVFK